MEKQRRIRKSVLKTEEFKVLGINLTLPSAYSLFKKDDQNKLLVSKRNQKRKCKFFNLHFANQKPANNFRKSN